MITRSGTHALKAMAYLASLPVGAYEGAGEIALQIKAPQNYLGKLLRLLAPGRPAGRPQGEQRRFSPGPGQREHLPV